MPGSHFDVVVVGAGAAGIAAARMLQAEGANYIVLEASSRLGGRALTDRSLGYPIDMGATWLHSADENILAEAPSAPFAEDTSESRVFLDDAPRWASPEEQEACRDYLDDCETRVVQAGEDGIGASIDQVVGHNSPYRRHFDWWCGAYTSVLPERVSALDWYRYHDTDANWTVPGGYGEHIICRAEGLNIQRDTPVLTIVERASGVRVTTPAGMLDARAVVLTASTDALQRIIFEPELPPEKHAALARLPLGRTNKVAMRFDRLDPEWCHARSAVLSVQFGRHNRPIAELFLDAAVVQALEAGGESAQIDFVMQQFCAMYGSAIRPRMQAARASNWGQVPWIWGAYSAMTPGGGDPRQDLAEPLADKLFFAGEATHPYFFSTAHGAWETGLRAANEALATHSDAE